MSLKSEKPSQSPKLNAPTWDSDHKAVFYGAARSTAHIFYARIQKETEEFLYHLLKQNSSLQQVIPKEEPQNVPSPDEDESLTKLKYLVMIHTTCSQITNLLVNSP